jgi:hypothetical protein
MSPQGYRTVLLGGGGTSQHLLHESSYPPRSSSTLEALEQGEVVFSSLPERQGFFHVLMIVIIWSDCYEDC